jgi:hypothetical protein
MIVSSLITQALRLINVPGRGATLSPDALQEAFESLQLLLKSKSVSKQYVPGIKTHFFTLTPGQYEFTYGPGGDLDTNDFEHPAPIKVEYAFMRSGGSIVNNEKADNDLFSDSSAWTLGSGWNITNGFANCVSDVGVLSQSITGLTIGVVYDVKIGVTSLSEGTADLTIGALSENIGADGAFEFTFTATATTHLLSLTPAATFSASIDNLSVRQINTERTGFEGTGTDWPLRAIDQKSYNRRYQKNSGGRPDTYIFSHNYPLNLLRFDTAPVGSEFIFLDVMVNDINAGALSDTIRMHDEALRWLRYQLAFEMAPEYGKQLKASAVVSLADARADLKAANLRWNNLRIDEALRPRRRYNINRGDY